MSPMHAVTPGVLVHGGAGRIAAERHDEVQAGVRAAAAAGAAVLAAGGAALDAVQAAVRVLEDDPAFNAGTGAVLNRDGLVEVDASIMDGATGRVGAVAAVPDLAEAIAVARAVLDDGAHVLLAGPAVWDFAAARGFVRAAPGALVTPRMRARWQDERQRLEALERDGGTVGAVAIDARGQLAAATSTGGTLGKLPGRIGDSPLPGCGTWASRVGAASATGDGEAIIRVTLTRALVDRIARGAAIAAAADEAIAELVAHGGSGGVIAVDAHGRFAAVHATETMPVALAQLDGDAIRVAAAVRAADLALA
ncbi:MAG: isoaspartyl peptidase/L-asparaginase [Deltaproteobacteria bacterium]|nr:isoaspartyl peptidase/L-asparaginase [Deltaproteobacteria bacterium]